MRRLSIILVLLFVAGCGVAIKTTEVPWDFQERVVQNPKVRIAVGDYYHDDVGRNFLGMPFALTGRLKTPLGRCVANAVQKRLPEAEVKVVPVENIFDTPVDVYIYNLKAKNYRPGRDHLKLRGEVKVSDRVYKVKGLDHAFGITENPFKYQKAREGLLDVCNQFAERLEEILRKEGLY